MKDLATKPQRHKEKNFFIKNSWCLGVFVAKKIGNDHESSDKVR
jgi:hypothetical protein